MLIVIVIVIVVSLCNVLTPFVILVLRLFIGAGDFVLRPLPEVRVKHVIAYYSVCGFFRFGSVMSNLNVPDLDDLLTNCSYNPG